MQQLLVDELTGDRVILVPARALRPDTFRVHAEPLPASVASCPFCVGNEHDTPPEVARLGDGDPDTAGWHLRVVPNKYPIVGDGVPGAHEVVIFSPAHDVDMGALSDGAATDVLLMLRDRSRFHLAHGCRYAQAFVNQGKNAGASIEHPHAQLVALDLVPPRVQVRLDRFAPATFTNDQKHKVVDGAVVVWCPPASPTPFTVRLALADGGPRFDEAADDETRAVGVGLRDAIARLRRALGDVAYNVMIESAPRDHAERFQWWVDVVPRVTAYAGFELATGLSVNIVAPAEAAAALQAV
ncbi:MAG: UDPglucose--hexose-phosphate uridylyltransferase [Actinomycetota bacterium]|jgi:UDPglucose--hexose-1-phosphate uridylyltransferase|nr:UDPglucose--hexose-phosphate uridylyltransferase [Actinomycetota bacterium]